MRKINAIRMQAGMTTFILHSIQLEPVRGSHFLALFQLKHFLILCTSLLVDKREFSCNTMKDARFVDFPHNWFCFNGWEEKLPCIEQICMKVESIIHGLFTWYSKSFANLQLLSLA